MFSSNRSLADVCGRIIVNTYIGCQKEIAEQIIDQGHDYLLAVKGNQENLHEDIAFFFDLCRENDFARVTHSHARTVNKGHGRIEVRECWAISGEESLLFLRGYEEWPQLRSIIRIDSERRLGDRVSRETHYYISSLTSDASHLLQVKRSHWAIENGLHWVLDIAFREDDSRVRLGHGPENLATCGMWLSICSSRTSLPRAAFATNVCKPLGTMTISSRFC